MIASAETAVILSVLMWLVGLAVSCNRDVGAKNLELQYTVERSTVAIHSPDNLDLCESESTMAPRKLSNEITKLISKSTGLKG
jgi:hypothetical protein